MQVKTPNIPMSVPFEEYERVLGLCRELKSSAMLGYLVICNHNLDMESRRNGEAKGLIEKSIMKRIIEPIAKIEGGLHVSNG